MKADVGSIVVGDNMNRKPKRLRDLTDPMLRADGKMVAFKIRTTDGHELDVELPLSEIAMLVQFLVFSADYLSQQAEQDGVDIDPPVSVIDPIPVRSLSISVGDPADQTILNVHVGGFFLSFALDSTKTAKFGDELAQVLRTLSANSILRN